MKQTLLFSLTLISITGFCQDTLKIRQIDSLVKVINESKTVPQTDSVIQELPGQVISRNYHIWIIDGSELKKYDNRGNTSIMDKENNMQPMKAANTFYFDHNALIKVEEFMIDGDKEAHMEWYYADDKLIHNKMSSNRPGRKDPEKGALEERAIFLLKMSKGLLKEAQSKKIPVHQ